MNGIIPNKHTKVIRCSSVGDLHLSEIVEAMPKGFYASLGTKRALSDYMNSIEAKAHPLVSPYSRPMTGPHTPAQIMPRHVGVKAWHIDYTITDSEFHDVLTDIKNYVNIEHFYYKCIVDNRDFLIFVGQSNVSVIYTDGKITSLEKENEKLEEENMNLRIKLTRIPRWLRYIFKSR